MLARATKLTAAALIAAAFIAGTLLATAPARAEECPGHPDALGTSRLIVVGPSEYTQLGTMQYPQTLPLADKEVVLTFDDGPLPHYTNQILDILTAQCVKATFFIIGEMARQFPDTVRREYAAGFTLGTHSQDHPRRFERLTGDPLKHEIDDGIASVSAALGDASEVAPFFRIPGLLRTPEIEQELAARSLVVFSSDIVADDWRHISPSQIVKRAMARLEKRGSGILLLHDIHAATVAALPELLKALKDGGFHIVGVVPPPPALMAKADAPKALTLVSALPSATIDGASAAAWPNANAGHTPVRTALPTPDPAGFDVDYPFEPDAGLGADSDADAHWPSATDPSARSPAPELPVPSPQNFGMRLAGEKLVSVDPASPSAANEPLPHAAETAQRAAALSPAPPVHSTAEPRPTLDARTTVHRHRSEHHVFAHHRFERRMFHHAHYFERRTVYHSHYHAHYRFHAHHGGEHHHRAGLPAGALSVAALPGTVADI